MLRPGRANDQTLRRINAQRPSPSLIRSFQTVLVVAVAAALPPAPPLPPGVPKVELAPPVPPAPPVAFAVLLGSLFGGVNLACDPFRRRLSVMSAAIFETDSKATTKCESGGLSGILVKAC